jgi:hypothetical protein
LRTNGASVGRTWSRDGSVLAVMRRRN